MSNIGHLAPDYSMAAYYQMQDQQQENEAYLENFYPECRSIADEEAEHFVFADGIDYAIKYGIDHCTDTDWQTWLTEAADETKDEVIMQAMQQAIDQKEDFTQLSWATEWFAAWKKRQEQSRQAFDQMMLQKSQVNAA